MKLAKKNLVTSPLLLRYDSSETKFLKTDRSTGRMECILILHDDSLQSLAAIKVLDTTRKCTFVLTLDGRRLPIWGTLPFIR